MNKLIKFIPSALLVLPMVASAQATFDLQYFSGAGTSIIAFINGVLIPLVFALALLVFFWGVFTYFILGAGDEEKRTTGRTYMVYGILGFVIIVAIWGIVALVISLFGVGGGTTLQPPLAPTTGTP